MPNHTVTLNLGAQPVAVYGGLRDLNNKVGAAAIVAHVRSSDDGTHFQDFSFLFGQVWKTRMDSLKNGTNKWTRIWQEDFHTFRVRQALEVNHWACTARDAIFELRINTTSSNFQPVFKVDIVSEWVSYGVGDGWPLRCHDKYLAQLHSDLLGARSEIAAQLAPRFAETSSATYYFVPEFGTRAFQIFYWK